MDLLSVADLEVGDNEVMPTVVAPPGLEFARLFAESVRVRVGPPS
jgi:hypothetical protein